MSIKTNNLSFENQIFHVGIDTHKKSWKVTIRSNSMMLKTFSQNPSPEELAAYMRKNYPGGIYRSVYEAGFCGYWIHRELTNLKFVNIITNAADVPTTNKEKRSKERSYRQRQVEQRIGKLFFNWYLHSKPTARSLTFAVPTIQTKYSKNSSDQKQDKRISQLCGTKTTR